MFRFHLITYNPYFIFRDKFHIFSKKRRDIAGNPPGKRNLTPPAHPISASHKAIASHSGLVYWRNEAG
jgi:hypothetical protein